MKNLFIVLATVALLFSCEKDNEGIEEQPITQQIDDNEVEEIIFEEVEEVEEVIKESDLEVGELPNGLYDEVIISEEIEKVQDKIAELEALPSTSDIRSEIRGLNSDLSALESKAARSVVGDLEQGVYELYIQGTLHYRLVVHENTFDYLFVNYDKDGELRNSIEAYDTPIEDWSEYEYVTEETTLRLRIFEDEILIVHEGSYYKYSNPGALFKQ